MQLNAHTSPTLSPKYNRAPPETVSAQTFHVCKQQLENASPATEDADELPSKISSQGQREGRGLGRRRDF